MYARATLRIDLYFLCLGAGPQYLQRRPPISLICCHFSALMGNPPNEKKGVIRASGEQDYLYLCKRPLGK